MVDKNEVLFSVILRNKVCSDLTPFENTICSHNYCMETSPMMLLEMNDVTVLVRYTVSLDIRRSQIKLH